ncbi:hypothetical protein BN871_AO_00240 [Paenibacillus sp. P22]|nr:hypothetical protein BN871_AO_00240 [Paenibacillus sp. P22]
MTLTIVTKCIITPSIIYDKSRFPSRAKTHFFVECLHGMNTLTYLTKIATFLLGILIDQIAPDAIPLGIASGALRSISTGSGSSSTDLAPLLPAVPIHPLQPGQLVAPLVIVRHDPSVVGQLMDAFMEDAHAQRARAIIGLDRPDPLGAFFADGHDPFDPGNDVASLQLQDGGLAALLLQQIQLGQQGDFHVVLIGSDGDEPVRQRIGETSDQLHPPHLLAAAHRLQIAFAVVVQQHVVRLGSVHINEIVRHPYPTS